MADRQPPPKKGAIDFVDNLSPDLVEGLAGMAEPEADMVRALLKRAGLDLFVDIFEFVHPHVQA